MTEKLQIHVHVHIELKKNKIFFYILNHDQNDKAMWQIPLYTGKVIKTRN